METTFFLILLSAGLSTSAMSSHYRQLFLTDNKMTWAQAQTQCRENYTDLITVYNEEERKHIMTFICQTTENLNTINLGLRRRQGTTKWSNGDIVHYDNRSDGDNGIKPYCHSMSASGRWENVNCMHNKPFMCYDKGDGHSSLSYTLIEQKRSWCDAQRYCRVHHTDLVSINSSSQNTQVQDLGHSGASFWIGLMSTDWEWSDGGCSSFRYFYPLPDLVNGIDCVQFSMNAKGNWHALNCSSPNYGLCYKDEVHLVRQPKTWEDALDHCNRREYRGLLRVESAQDQRFLETALKRSNVSGPVWLGLRQSRLFGFWFWPNGANVEWSNWEGGSQPEKPLSHICGAIATSGPGKFKWSDRDCLSKSYFLCEGEERQAALLQGRIVSCLL